MNSRKERLKELVETFDSYFKSGNFDSSSEASARTWIEKLLEIFEWDVSNPLEVDQESKISNDAKQKMKEIESTHKTPDYAFMLGDNVLSYLDAKKIDIDIDKCKKSSFQIRSYGWSSGTPCSFITNFREMAIYDSRYKPSKDQSADNSRVHYFTYEQFVENYDVLEQHLLKSNVQSRKLSDMYSQYESIRGTKTLDEDFSELLSKWRLIFAKEIFKANKKIAIEAIQDEVQVFLDRVIFLRVAEGKNIEKFGQLKSIFSQKNSFKKFESMCNGKFNKKYGGYLFSKRKNGLKYTFCDKDLSEFVGSLYFPFPYRFEVIPAELLGNMYEQYLGKQLKIENKKIVDDFKPEYQKTKGAVYTPKYIVDVICRSTLKPLIRAGSIRSIVNLDVIDPSCGSGSFLLGVFDYIESCLKNVIRTKKNLEKKYDSWYWVDPRRNKIHIKVSAKRHLINSCIYGVDIDPQAVEVSRLSLALKALEGSESEPAQILELNLQEPKILNSIGENIKNGNSLIDSVVLKRFPELVNEIDELDRLRIFDWEGSKAFENVFQGKGGFDAVVGNPPYIETKHYKNENPYMHRVLTLRSNKIYESAGGGKLDVAMPFIERGIKKLNKNGRLGYIVTNRFFKTDYGKSPRDYLSKYKHIESILDFGELKVFKGRSTYTCILTTTQNRNERFSYKKIKTLDLIEHNLPVEYINQKEWDSFSLENVNGNPWDFSNPELLKLKEDLLLRHKAIEDQNEIKLKVGLQVTWDKIYHIKPIKIKGSNLVGKNGFGEQVTIELAATRPTVCNDRFYSYRQAKGDVYSIFPYEIKNGKDFEIKFKEFKKRFPLAAAYLSKNKAKLISEVETLEEAGCWHLYTRKQNLVTQNQPKIIFPTTIIDTVATFDENGELYQDNARIFSVIIEGADIELYKAISAVFNSSIFNSMAKVTSNPLQEGLVIF